LHFIYQTPLIFQPEKASCRFRRPDVLNEVDAVAAGRKRFGVGRVTRRGPHNLRLLLQQLGIK
jgi:hypothetical protein